MKKRKKKTPASVFRAARETAGYTQDQLVPLLLISQTTISEYENGKHEPKPKVWEAFAKLIRKPIRVPCTKCERGTKTYPELYQIVKGK